MKEREYNAWQRVWPTLLTALIGFVLVGALAGFVGTLLHDPDTAVIVAICLGLISGIPIGLVCAKVWEMRGRHY